MQESGIDGKFSYLRDWGNPNGEISLIDIINLQKKIIYSSSCSKLKIYSFIKFKLLFLINLPKLFFTGIVL